MKNEFNFLGMGITINKDAFEDEQSYEEHCKYTANLIKQSRLLEISEQKTFEAKIAKLNVALCKYNRCAAGRIEYNGWVEREKDIPVSASICYGVKKAKPLEVGDILYYFDELYEITDVEELYRDEDGLHGDVKLKPFKI